MPDRDCTNNGLDLQIHLAGAGLGPYEDDFRELLADLSVEAFDDRRLRGDRVLAALPELWRHAEALMPTPPPTRTHDTVE